MNITDQTHVFNWDNLQNLFLTNTFLPQCINYPASHMVKINGKTFVLLYLFETRMKEVVMVKKVPTRGKQEKDYSFESPEQPPVQLCVDVHMHKLAQNTCGGCLCFDYMFNGFSVSRRDTHRLFSWLFIGGRL